MNRQKILAICVVCFGALGMLFFHQDSNPSLLTREAVYHLVEAKGANNITWSDFEQYPYKEVGSGNYVHEYLLADGSKLYLSGASLSQVPMYVSIVNQEGESETIVSNEKR